MNTLAAIAPWREANDSRVVLQAVHQGRTFQIVDDGKRTGFRLRTLGTDLCTLDQRNSSIWQAKQYSFRDFAVPENAWKLGTRIA